MRLRLFALACVLSLAAGCAESGESQEPPAEESLPDPTPANATAAAPSPTPVLSPTPSPTPAAAAPPAAERVAPAEEQLKLAHGTRQRFEAVCVNPDANLARAEWSVTEPGAAAPRVINDTAQLQSSRWAKSLPLTLDVEGIWTIEFACVSRDETRTSVGWTVTVQPPAPTPEPVPTPSAAPSPSRQPTPEPSPEPQAAPTPTPSPTPSASTGRLVAHASVDKPTPCQSQVVTVTVVVEDEDGAPVAGALVDTTWNYASKDSYAEGTTDTSGTVRLDRPIGGAKDGFTVKVDVKVTKGALRTTTQTEFTPRTC